MNSFLYFCVIRRLSLITFLLKRKIIKVKLNARKYDNHIIKHNANEMPT